MEIIPAIMPEEYADIEHYARVFRGVVPRIQLDIMDGAFVPPVTWPYGEDAERFDALARGAEGLPLWQDLAYEIDLMIARPEARIDTWIATGASRLFFHIEAIDDPERFFAHEIFHDRRSEFLQIGLACAVDTPVERVLAWRAYIDAVQCMGIARVGYQGEPFDERAVHKVAALREAAPDLIISVDGGVDADTAPRLSHAGADRLVSGSAILEDDEPAAAVADIRRAAQS